METKVDAKIDRLTDAQYDRLNAAVEDQFMPRTMTSETVVGIVNEHLAESRREICRLEEENERLLNEIAETRCICD